MAFGNKVMDIIKKLGHGDEEKEELDDSQTRDKYLRSLRRERRTQMELLEKRKLKEDIAEFKKKELREGMFGVKSDEEKKKQLIEKLKMKREQVNILADKKKLLQEKSLLNNKKDEFKKKEKSILSDNSTMLGKGFL